MAIQIFCPICKSSHSLDAKKCAKCQIPFGRNKKYRVCVSKDGRRITKVVDNLTLAREAEGTIKADILRKRLDILQPKQVPTINDVWIQFLDWAKGHKKTWKTDQYLYEKHVNPRFGKMKLDSITPMDIEKLKMDLGREPSRTGRPFTKASIRHLLVLLKHLYNIARKWELYAGSNPIDSVDFPRLDNQRTEFMSGDELGRLLRVLDSWPCPGSAAFVKFALYTGFRRGELFKLTWEDVDLERKVITLREPKGGKTETIPISDKAASVLSSLEKVSTYVFPGKDGKQRADFKGPWLRIRKAAQLPPDFRFHGLRHHFASSLVSNGIDLYTVGKLLCHKKSTTTQRYAHMSDERLRQAAQKSGDILSVHSSDPADQEKTDEAGTKINDRQ